MLMKSRGNGVIFRHCVPLYNKWSYLPRQFPVHYNDLLCGVETVLFALRACHSKSTPVNRYKCGCSEQTELLIPELTPTACEENWFVERVTRAA
jgi:hypothetical protein